MKSSPTARIVSFARLQPGGVIRWREARRIYIEHSAAAQRWIRCGGPFHFHMALGVVLRRHFEKVDGVDGFYVLKESMRGDDDQTTHA